MIIFSFLFALAIVFGLNCNSLAFRATIDAIIPQWSFIHLFEVILIAFLTYIIINFLRTKLDFSRGNHFQSVTKVFWLSFFVIAGTYLIASLCYYPCNILPDSMNSLNHTLYSPEVSLSNHHPICYSALISFFINFGKIFLKLDLLKSIYLYTLFQIIFIAFVLSYAIKVLAEIKTNKYILILLIALFALFPHFSMFAVSMWKDPIFSAAVVLLSVLLFKLLLNREFEHSTEYIVLLCIAILFTLFFRNNGIYIVIATLLVIIICNFKQFKITKWIMTLYICFYYLFTGIGYDLLNIEKVKVEAFAIPIQQIANTISHDEQLFEPEDLSFLNEILPIETWKEVYTPRCVDDIKWNGDFNKEYFAENIGRFLGIYLRTLPRAFNLYVDSYLASTQGFWDPVNQINHEYYASQIGVIDNNLGIYQRDIFAEHGLNMKAVFSGTPLVSTGLMFWLILLSTIIILRNKGKESMIIFVPYLALWFTIMVATPLSFGARYALPLFYGMPLCLVFALNNNFNISKSKEVLLPMNRKNILVVFALPLLFPTLLGLMINSRDEYITIGYSDVKEELSFNNGNYYSQPFLFDTDVCINRISFNTFKKNDEDYTITFAIKDRDDNILDQVCINSKDLVISEDRNNWTDIRFDGVKLNASEQYYLEIHGSSKNENAGGLVVGYSSTSPLLPISNNLGEVNKFLNIKIIGKIK